MRLATFSGDRVARRRSRKGRTMPTEPELVVPTIEAIRRWSGVAVPNAAARHGLADHAALIAELEALRARMVFEDEPSSFEAALRDCREQGEREKGQ
jgi:hypothetical protein